MPLSVVSIEMTIMIRSKTILAGKDGSAKIDTKWKKNDIFSFFIDRNAPDFGMIGYTLFFRGLLKQTCAITAIAK